jgi:hypothetical protein
MMPLNAFERSRLPSPLLADQFLGLFAVLGEVRTTRNFSFRHTKLLSLHCL